MDDAADDGPRVRFLIGGARSGKSRLAVRLARGDPDVLFLATARPGDEEMERRVERHRRNRPEGWTTVEAPLDLPETIRRRVEPRHTVLLDCLTLWVSNLMTEGGDGDTGAESDAGREGGVGPGGDPGGEVGAGREDRILGRAEDLASAMGEHGRRWIVVSNEVGTGLHPPTRIGRRYRDLLGRVNQRVAASADQTLLVVAGRVVELEAPPVAPDLGSDAP